MQNIVIFYHANCTDGFAAAYAAWLKFKNKATYIPLEHYQTIPEVSGKQIFMLDFSTSSENLKKLLENNLEVTIIDHHLADHENLQEFIATQPERLKVHFDASKSGCVLAWNFWHSSPLPGIFSHIQDRDLNSYSLPFVKEVISALMTYEKKFEIWHHLKVNDLIKEGKTILRVQNQIIEEMLQRTQWVEIDGFVVPAVNASIYWSDATFKLLEKFPEAPFVVAYYEIDGVRTKWSIRKSPQSKINLLTLVNKFNGGGHELNGGFSTLRGQIPFVNPKEHLRAAS